MKRGSVFRRGGSWTVKVERSRDPVTGKRRYYWRGGFRTKREASDHLALVLAEIVRGSFIPPSREALADYAQQWLASRAVDHTTHASYRSAICQHILPVLGAVCLADLRREHGLALLDQLRARRLAPGTIYRVWSVARRLLAAAVREGLLPRDPLATITVPAPRSSCATYLSAEDTRRLIRAAYEVDPGVGLLVLLAASSGMRRGELLGLRWEAVDLDRGVLTIRRARRLDGTTALPKTAMSRRSIVLGADALAALKRHPREGEYVFSLRGQPISVRDFRMLWWVPARARAGLKLRFHDLRHTHATLLLAAGTSFKVVQERLGHARAQTTLNLYAHVVPGMQADAARCIDRLLHPVADGLPPARHDDNNGV